VVGALVLVGSACSSGAPIGGASDADAGEVPVTAPPNRSLTSFGAQFLTTCSFSHSLPDDPIVHPGKPGASHLHEFFGNTTTDAFSTSSKLVDQPSTCSDDGDRSAYWVPALIVDEKRVEPTRIDAYYRVAPGIAPSEVKVYPKGLQSIAGNQHATTPPSLDAVAWTCGLSPHLSHRPPKDCGTDRRVVERLTFPSCWDGKHTSSPDFVSHLSYPTVEDGCDAAHPVALPQLTMVVHYPLFGTYKTARLASGGFDTAHGDFFEAWQPERITDQVTGCINRGVTCGIVGGTFHTGRGNGDKDQYNFPPGTGSSTTAPSYDNGVTTTVPPPMNHEMAH
jgi:hypothetical protein